MKMPNNMTTYQPHPIDTADVALSAQLQALTEQLAENVHEVWSAGRIAEGWKYGEQRDEVRKLHPCLVPYNRLPESEKEFDRNTAMQTIKTIVKLGYKIEK